MTDLMKLKSGTDIRGIASDKGGKPVDLTDDVIAKILVAFAKWITEKTGKPAAALTVAVGHDSRISAERMKSAVIKGLCSSGINVIDCGLASTPAMFMTTQVSVQSSEKPLSDAAIQITASHHPFDRNGLKFFTSAGGLDSPDITQILTYAGSEKFSDSSVAGKPEKLNFMPVYSGILRSLICKELETAEENKPLSGFHFVVDAGNGAGGFYAADVLAPLGADISGSQFLEPDGMFPNHTPNPEDKTAMSSVSHATTAAGADLGIIFDTDVDRAGCVDGGGREINRNRLVALAAAIALEGNDGGTVVTDSITSDGLKTFIESELGGTHYRYKRGYKNVINKAMQLNQKGINCPLAIETSGHAALRENYFLDDGAYLITKIIIKLVKLRKSGKTIESLIGSMPEPLEELELRFSITEADFKALGEKIIESLQKFAESIPDWQIAGDNREGLRVSTEDGWFLLRLSVHDPIMPMNIESAVKGGVHKTLKSLVQFLEQCDGLDITPLEDALALNINY